MKSFLDYSHELISRNPSAEFWSKEEFQEKYDEYLADHDPNQKKATIIRTYKGNQDAAFKQFAKDSEKLKEKGYIATSKDYAVGQYGCSSFIAAALLCFIFVGIIIFVYMIIVKPEGCLTVTYELNEKLEEKTKEDNLETKICPECAETIKKAAKVCRFCGNRFDDKET